jgi:ParB-like chromosome segregation protein Spo0J
MPSVGQAEALEISLAENSGRESMYPSDLVMAFRALIDSGLSPDEIAPRFGVSRLTVKRYRDQETRSLDTEMKRGRPSSHAWAPHDVGGLNYPAQNARATGTSP